jgi:hypothetical protein
MKREYVRKDGTCLKCRKPRNPKRNPYSGIAPFLDPFCSSSCCKEYHGVKGQTPLVAREKGVSKWDDGSQRRARLRLERELQAGHKPSHQNYKSGCRCDDCKAAYSVWRKEWRAAKKVAA